MSIVFKDELREESMAEDEEQQLRLALLARDAILSQIGQLESRFMAPDLRKRLNGLRQKAEEKLASLESAINQRRQLKLRIRRVLDNALR